MLVTPCNPSIGSQRCPCPVASATPVPQAFSGPLLGLPVSSPHPAPAQVPARLWCEVEVGFIYKFPLIMSHRRNCLQTGDKVWGRLARRKTLFTFDFPLGTGHSAPGLARICQPLLFSEAEAHLPPVLSARPPCCVNRTQGWRPGPALEMSVPSAARPLPPHIRRLLRVQMRAGGQE